MVNRVETTNLSKQNSFYVLCLIFYKISCTTCIRIINITLYILHSQPNLYTNILLCYIRCSLLLEKPEFVHKYSLLPCKQLNKDRVAYLIRGIEVWLWKPAKSIPVETKPVNLRSYWDCSPMPISQIFSIFVEISAHSYSPDWKFLPENF